MLRLWLSEFRRPKDNLRSSEEAQQRGKEMTLVSIEFILDFCVGLEGSTNLRVLRLTVPAPPFKENVPLEELKDSLG